MTVEEQKELNPEQQAVFDYDESVLQQVAISEKIPGLEGRVKFGLDPAAMLALDHKRASFGEEIQVEGTKKYAYKIAKEFGADEKKVWELILELHKTGPWANSDRLTDSTEPEIKTYLVLAAVCQESAWPGYNKEAYLKDRARVVDELKKFKTEGFEGKRQELMGQVKIDKVTEVQVGQDIIKVPIVEGDVALPLAMQGYKGCVSKEGEMYFAQTSSIEDSTLEGVGLVPGFGEKYDSTAENGEGGYVRVPVKTEGARVIWVDATDVNKDINKMQPVVKRIASGYVLAYNNEELAKKLVAFSVASKEKQEPNKEKENSDFEKITKQLGEFKKAVYEENPKTNEWLEEFEKIKEENGLEDFKELAKKLFIWAAKSEMGFNFFWALAEVNPGLSLELYGNGDNLKIKNELSREDLEDLVFAYIQTMNDGNFLDKERKEIDAEIKIQRDYMKQDGETFDTPAVTYAEEKRDTNKEKLQNYYKLSDVLESAMWEAGLNPQDMDPEVWVKSFTQNK